MRSPRRGIRLNLSGCSALVAEESVSGGVVNVRGDVWPFNLNPVILELIGPDGKSIGLADPDGE